MNITKILDEMYALFKDYPTTELEYATPFQLLTAVVLSAQTTDIQVNKVTQQLFSVVQTPQDMVDLWEKWLKNYIKTVGLHQSKAKNLFATSQLLVEKTTSYSWATTEKTEAEHPLVYKDTAEVFAKHGYYIPDTIEEMVTLPGVGIKTAKVVLYVLYGQRRVAVDTHVHRVMNRLWVVKTQTPEQTSKLLETLIPDDYKDVAHHVVIYFGRYLCKAKKPECRRCPLVKQCGYSPKNLSA